MRVAVESKRFGETPVLGQIGFDAGAGERIVLTGRSGIGKSTLLRLIAGLDTAFDGRIEGAGRLAMVFQEPVLLPWRSARDNIVLAGGVSEAEAEALLRQVELDGKAALYPGQLSLGQQRRVAIARAFARKPDTLLMDEPFASLDSETATAMRGLLMSMLADRKARLILVSHDLSEAAQIADRTIHLAGNPAAIADQSAVTN